MFIECTYDPDSKGGWTKDGRKVKGTLHWVSIRHAINAQINIYDRLFNIENPKGIDNLNSKSLTIVKKAYLEPSLQTASYKQHYQFVRNGYFILDKNSNKNNLIFNRSVPLRDSWNKK